MRCCSYNSGLIVLVMFGNFAKIGRFFWPQILPKLENFGRKFPNITSTINPELYEQHRMITCLLLDLISMTKLDTYRCQHHILSPKPSPAILSTKIWCFCSYFHLVLLLKQNLVLLFVFSSSSSTAISFHICV